MNKDEKLNNGTQVEISVPYLYTIGEESRYREGKLMTIQDCKDEFFEDMATETFVQPGIRII